VSIQNVNGISAAYKFEELHEIADSAVRMGTSIVGLVEKNVEWNNTVHTECRYALGIGVIGSGVAMIYKEV
jgi:hypothetical protein